MMLKELFQSWFKRHEHKHEEVPMSDSATDLAAAVPATPSVQVVQDVTVPDASAVSDVLHAPDQVTSQDPVKRYDSDPVVDVAAMVPPIPAAQLPQDKITAGPATTPAPGDLLTRDFGNTDPTAWAYQTEGKVQHDAFAEKLRHVLKLAEVEIEHVWDEAVALAKKLV